MSLGQAGDRSQPDRQVRRPLRRRADQALQPPGPARTPSPMRAGRGATPPRSWRRRPTPCSPPCSCRSRPATPHSAATYIDALLAQAPKLLKGHLHTRTFFMVVLSRSQAPEVIKTLDAQLVDPDQPLMVKLLAAVGLTNISQNGRRALDPNNQAIPASQALSQFLAENPDAFWPVKWRALEAMGSIRMATANPLRGEAEFTSRALQDPGESGGEAAGPCLGRLGTRHDQRAVAGPPVQLRADRLRDRPGRRRDRRADPRSCPYPRAQPTQNLRIVGRLSDPLLRLLAAFVGDSDLRGSGLSNAQHPAAREAQGDDPRRRAAGSGPGDLGPGLLEVGRQRWSPVPAIGSRRTSRS